MSNIWHNKFKMLAITYLVLVIASIVLGEPYGSHMRMNDDTRCPRSCQCNGVTVDCSHRGFTQVPRRIPLDTERL